MRLVVAAAYRRLPFTLTFLLAAPLAPAEPTSNEAAANATEPADTRPADDDPGARAVRAARAFLAAAGKPDDKAAYAMTTPAYHVATSSEKFSAAMTELRANAEFTGATPVQGWALVKPAKGEPRRALLVANGLRGRREPARPGRGALVGLDLVEQEDGRWAVAEVRELDAKNSRQFTAPIMKSGTRDGAARMVSSAVRGIITEVKGDAVTVRLHVDARTEAASPPRLRTMKIRSDTAVLVAVATDAPMRLPARPLRNNNGRPAPPTVFRSYAVRPGTAADLLPDREVTLHPTEDENGAVTVEVIRPAWDADPARPGL